MIGAAIHMIALTRARMCPPAIASVDKKRSEGMSNREAFPRKAPFLPSIAVSLYACVIDKEAVMTTVTISPKYQVVIPKSIRESLGLKPGQKVQAIEYNGRVELVPVRPVRQMRGFLSGIDTTVPREDDRV